MPPGTFVRPLLSHSAISWRHGARSREPGRASGRTLPRSLARCGLGQNVRFAGRGCRDGSGRDSRYFGVERCAVICSSRHRISGPWIRGTSSDGEAGGGPAAGGGSGSGRAGCGGGGRGGFGRRAISGQHSATRVQPKTQSPHVANRRAALQPAPHGPVLEFHPQSSKVRSSSGRMLLCVATTHRTNSPDASRKMRSRTAAPRPKRQGTYR